MGTLQDSGLQKGEIEGSRYQKLQGISMRWPQGTQKGNQHNNLQLFVNVCMPHATCFMLFCYVLLDWDSSFTSSVRKPASKILGKESVGLNG